MTISIRDAAFCTMSSFTSINFDSVGLDWHGWAKRQARFYLCSPPYLFARGSIYPFDFEPNQADIIFEDLPRGKPLHVCQQRIK